MRQKSTGTPSNLYEEGEIRQTVSAENAARTAALDACRSVGPHGKVHILASAGPTGLAGLYAARILSNWLSQGNVRVGFLGVDDYAYGIVRKAVFTTRELSAELTFLTKDEAVQDFLDKSKDGLLLIAAAAEDGGYRAEVGETEAAAAPAPNKVFLKFEGGLVTLPPDPTVPMPHPDVPPLSRDDVRNLDRIALDKYGISGLSLMENAGWNLARETFLEIKSGRLAPPVLVLAGRGNNGGDGLVAARHLAAWNIDCRVAMVGADKPSTEDALVNFRLAAEAGVTIIPTSDTDIAVLPPLLEKAKSVIDAVLGTGLTGRLKGVTADALGMLAESGLPVIAADIPSGLDANTGEPLGKVPKALVTVTFAASKIGFDKARDYTGEVRVADIGAPWDIARRLAQC